MRLVVACVCAVPILIVAGALLTLAAVDHGLLDRPIQDALSAKTGQRITFSRLETHLLAAHPSIAVDGLVIASPPAVSKVNALEAPRLTAQVDLLPLMAGRFSSSQVILERPLMRFVRIRHGLNNYSLGGSGSSEGLAGVRRLTITRGTLYFDDVERRITLKAAVSHDGAARTPRPFLMTGGGIIADQPYTVVAHGAPLNGRARGAPYPFDAVVRDGATEASVDGASGKPFDFRVLDLTLKAAGPNLADLTYLFGALAPNSPPFRLSGHLWRNEPALTLTGITGKVGDSDVRGDIASDHKPGTRRLISARLTAQALYLRDLRAMLAPHPGHAAARDRSGAVAKSPSTGLFPQKPFNTKALNKTDLHLDIRAARMPDAPVTVASASAVMDLHGGKLALSPVTFATSPGRASGALTIDASRKTPLVSMKGTLTGAQLTALRPSLTPLIDGDLDLAFDLHGQGASPQAAVSDMQGRAAFRLSAGRVQKTKAAALGGNLLQAIGLSLGPKDKQTGLTCAVGELKASAGRFQADRLAIVTDIGTTWGQGVIDAGQQSLSLSLAGTPAHPGLFRISPPVQIEGPLLKPKVKLGGPKPPAPTAMPSCATLMAEAGRFVGAGAVLKK